MSTFGLSASPEEAKGTLLDTADRQAEWIRRTFIDQTRRLVEQGFPDIAFLVIGQGIETMGPSSTGNLSGRKGSRANAFPAP